MTLPSGLINLADIKLGEAGHASVSVLRSLTAAVSDGDSDRSSHSEFSDLTSDTVESVLEDLRVDTTCLQDLEPLLCCPILRTDPEPAATLDSTRITWSPHQLYSDKVSFRFPKAADDLIIRLGKANYERYLRCQEQRAANDSGDCPPDQIADSSSSKFHDSGLGSSLASSPSAYAETVMSYGMGEGRRMRVPPLPAQAKEGLPFACVACGKWIKISTNSAWKQHVYRDLQPWICLEADCHMDTGTFQSRNDWISHLALDHGMDPEWRMIDCPLCRVEVGPGKLSITRHMSDHLEEISLSALPADCEYDQESEEGEPDGEDDLFADNASGEIKLYGGIAVNGRPAQLVQVNKDGQAISLATGEVIDMNEEPTFKLRRSAPEEAADEDEIMRSMARRKKNASPEELAPKKCREPGCNREFKRPCDLTKHEKTHSRPWKCPIESCKYHEYGWPTEKEMDRHCNDKHSVDPSMYKCLFPPCTYKSKRESNCRRHMEVAHGWQYTRTKGEKKSLEANPSIAGTLGIDDEGYIKEVEES